jgi:hypothetical protein
MRLSRTRANEGWLGHPGKLDVSLSSTLIPNQRLKVRGVRGIKLSYLASFDCGYSVPHCVVNEFGERMEAQLEHYL